MLIPLLCITALYVAAAVLPVLGLARALRPIREIEERRAAAGLPPDDEVSRVMDLDAFTVYLNPRRRRREFHIDITFVGLGLASGAAASIWALWLFV